MNKPLGSKDVIGNSDVPGLTGVFNVRFAGPSQCVLFIAANGNSPHVSETFLSPSAQAALSFELMPLSHRSHNGDFS